MASQDVSSAAVHCFVPVFRYVTAEMYCYPYGLKLHNTPFVFGDANFSTLYMFSPSYHPIVLSQDKSMMSYCSAKKKRANFLCLHHPSLCSGVVAHLQPTAHACGFSQLDSSVAQD